MKNMNQYVLPCIKEEVEDEQFQTFPTGIIQGIYDTFIDPSIFEKNYFKRDKIIFITMTPLMCGIFLRIDRTILIDLYVDWWMTYDWAEMGSDDTRMKNNESVFLPKRKPGGIKVGIWKKKEPYLRRLLHYGDHNDSSVVTKKVYIDTLYHPLAHLLLHVIANDLDLLGMIKEL